MQHGPADLNRSKSWDAGLVTEIFGRIWRDKVGVAGQAGLGKLLAAPWAGLAVLVGNKLACHSL